MARYDDDTVMTIAVLSDYLHRSESYQPAYRRWADRVGGFPAFYQLAVDAGAAFERAARRANVEWGGDVEYWDSLHDYVNRIYDFLEESDQWATASELDAIIGRTIPFAGRKEWKPGREE